MQDDGEANEDEERQLRTRRLILRPPRRSDVAALAAALDDPRIAMGLASVPYPYRRSDAEGWVDRERARAGSGGVSYVAISAAEGCFVGAGFSCRSDTWPDGFELSFWIAQRHWGRGLGTEVAHAVVDDAFLAAGVERIWCAIRVNSTAARRVVEKCGFQFRDQRMLRSIAARGTVPVERFVLERRVWTSLKAWGAEAPAQRVAGAIDEDDDASDAA